jgi:formylglycine-generating enzyme required for sulfatase activity
VTVGRFRQFVAAWDGGSGLDGGPGYVPPAGSGKHAHLNGGAGLANNARGGTFESGWLATDDAQVDPTDTNLGCDPNPSFASWTPVAGPQERLPIDCVTWYEAYAFCIWDGGFLPSEAEWEYAAAGGGGTVGQREYPWGTAMPGTGNQYAIYHDYYYQPLPGGVGLPYMAPVGTALLGAGLWGQLDLVGDVQEWVLDSLGPYVNPCVDCGYLTPTTTSERMARGANFDTGDFGGNNLPLEPPTRIAAPETQRGVTVGLRCARPPL